MSLTLISIRNCASLNNLKKANACGQIATILILVITAILIFTLVVMNIGQVSNYATNLSNAADSASMYFASQLGTKAYVYSYALYDACEHPYKCCEVTGWAAVILAVVIAIVCIVLCYVVGMGAWGLAAEASFLTWLTTSWVAIAAGAVGGAIGGAIGGAYMGTGWVQGAIMGAMIGMSIASLASAGAGALGGTMVGGTLVITNVTWAAIGAILGATIVAAANIYSTYAADQMLWDAMGEAVRKLAGLNETLRIRESVFLQALSQTIDDPNKVLDLYDSDGDENSAELVPAFQYCWDRRISALAGEVRAGGAVGLVQAFLTAGNSATSRFQGQAKAFLGHISRREIEGEDGTITHLFRVLENAGYDVSFWRPGPTAEELQAWYDSIPKDCPDCPYPDPPLSYDELDYDIDELNDFDKEVEELKKKSDQELADTWETWAVWFYDPESNPDVEGNPGDYYHSFGEMLDGSPSTRRRPRIGLRAWIDELERIRLSLPNCKYGWYLKDENGNRIDDICRDCAGTGSPLPVPPVPCPNECIFSYRMPNRRPNPPCRGRPNDPNFATIDTDWDNEFKEAEEIISAFIDQVEAYRQACKDFYETMQALEDWLKNHNPEVSECKLTGTNPIYYEWKDSRGDHSIRVTLSNYEMPQIIRRKSGNWWKGKKCMILINGDQNVSVTIERNDPANVEVGILGIWNPYGGTIKRTSTSYYRGYYTDNSVKVVGR